MLNEMNEIPLSVHTFKSPHPLPKHLLLLLVSVVSMFAEFDTYLGTLFISFPFHLIYLRRNRHPSAMKLISKGPSTSLLAIDQKVTEKVEIKIQTS